MAPKPLLHLLTTSLTSLTSTMHTLEHLDPMFITNQPLTAVLSTYRVTELITVPVPVVVATGREVEFMVLCAPRG
jgi:hypothetical protein